MVTEQFNAPHAVLQIFFGFDGAVVYDVEEAWPAAAAFKFCGAVKKGVFAAGTCVNAIFMVVPKFARKWSFCSALPQNAILFRCEGLAPVYSLWVILVLGLLAAYRG